MHESDLSPGDIVTIKPKTQYIAGIWFESLSEQTVEWTRRLENAYERNYLSVVETHDVDELGNLRLSDDRHLYFDDEAHSSVHYDSTTEEVVATNDGGPEVRIPRGPEPVEIDELAADGIESQSLAAGGPVMLGGVRFWFSDTEPAEAAEDDVWVETTSDTE